MKNLLKKYEKILISLILILVLLIFSNNIYATDSIIQGAENFLAIGHEDILNTDNIKISSDLIYNVFLAVGTVIVVLVGAVLGIQFIMGSVEEKAKVQESLIPYIVGTVVIFGAFGIWKVVVLVLYGSIV